MSKRISKSRFINYCQCPKKLWLDPYHPELADEMDQTVFKNGTMVGELAQDLFLCGIYEAAFSHSALLAICDIIVKVNGAAENLYDVYEVKSSTELKDVYIYDVA